jgi:TolB-like protein/Tfp pilus assembly protein PilF
MNMPRSGFFAELKRRKVVRVAVVYAATAFVVLQVADIMLPRLGVPDWAMSLIVLLVALGFPVALVLAWALELTPDGLRVTAAPTAGDHDQPPPSLLGKRTVLASALLVAVGAGLGAGWFLKPAPSIHDSAVPPGDSAAADLQRSIAVLPFVNMSAEPEQEYFSDGISEEILNVLVRTPGLQVAARTSSFAFKGSAREISQIARELNVRLVLEGSVRKQGERVRVTAQLIDATSGFHLWSESFDRELRDIFAIQDEIARAVATALDVTLGGTAQPTAAPAHDLEAYDLYLQGLALWQARGESNMRNADALFRAALELDPGLARGWAGLGLVHAVLPEWTTAPADVSAAIARDAAERALALDRDLPEPFIVLAYLAQTELRFQTSQALYERALVLAPSHATGHQWFGFMLSNLGEFEQAIRIGRRAVELDPRSLIVRTELANTYYTAGRFDEERALCERLLAEAPDWTLCHLLHFNRAFATGDRDGMRAVLITLGQARGGEALPLAQEMAEALAGIQETDVLAARVVGLRDGFLDPSSPLALDDHSTVLWLAATGHPDHALVRLARHAATHPWYVRGYLAGGRLDVLRCQPGFADILRTVQLPPDANGSVCGREGRP